MLDSCPFVIAKKMWAPAAFTSASPPKKCALLRAVYRCSCHHRLHCRRSPLFATEAPRDTMLRAATNCTARRPFVSRLSRCFSRGSLESGLVGVHVELVMRCSVCSMCVSLSFPTPPATSAQCGYLLCPWSFGLCLQASPTLLNLVMACLSLVRLASAHIKKWLLFFFLIWRTRITAGQHSLTGVVSWRPTRKPVEARAYLRVLPQHCENSMCEHNMAVALLSA